MPGTSSAKTRFALMAGQYVGLIVFQRSRKVQTYRLRWIVSTR
jgi:hypothetical protein